MALQELDREEFIEGARQVITNLVERVWEWLRSLSEQIVDWVVDHLPNWLIRLLNAFAERANAPA